MDLVNRLFELKARIDRQRGSVGTEEATKTAFVLPFIQALGYDIFDPSEVVPELTADHGVKRGEKVDYAIKQDGRVVMLIECKAIGSNLEAKHAGQLYRYFSVTDARFGVLTDGIRYVFYTDLEKPNTMDRRPFFEFDVTDHRNEHVDELRKFAKHSFDLNTILDTATNLKYHKALLTEIRKEVEAPSSDVVRLFASRVYPGRITAQVKEQFETLVQRALRDFVRERIEDRLKSALLANASSRTDVDRDGASELNDAEAPGPDPDGIETTPEEWEAFRIVQAIGAEQVDPTRIFMRDAKSYCAILLDDNNRRTICRLHFGKRRLAITVFLPDGETRWDIDETRDLYALREPIGQAIGHQLSGDRQTPPIEEAGATMFDVTPNVQTNER